MAKSNGGLVDLKRTKADKKKASESNKIGSIDGDDYPYGTRVSLGPDELDKLGTTTLPGVGTEVHVHARGHVTSVSEDHREGGKKHRRVEIQLKHMHVQHGKPQQKGRVGGRHADMADGAKAEMDKALAAKDGDDDADGDAAPGTDED